MRFVGDLDRVAEIPLPEVEPQAHCDLELVDEDEEEDVDAGVETLPEDHRRKRPRPDRDRGPRGEERIGDPHHLPHQRNMGDRENDNHEDRRRQRQIAGQFILLVGVRPVAEEGDEVGYPEQHRFDRKQVRKDRQKRRQPPRRHGRDRGQRRSAADHERHAVFLIGADHEREDGENGETQ